VGNDLEARATLPGPCNLLCQNTTHHRRSVALAGGSTPRAGERHRRQLAGVTGQSRERLLIRSPRSSAHFVDTVSLASSDRRVRDLLIISTEANILLVVREPVASVRARPTLSEFEVVFDALAHEARRHIVQVLAHYGPELPSGYLAKRFTHSWPTTTRHLHILEDAGIVSVRRDGRSCIYRLERDRLERVVGGWLALLEPSSPRQTWRSPRPRSVRKVALR
jgi:DNA-binding transcriptional ArsR family regulator